MDRDAIVAKVISVVVETLDIDEASIDESSDFKDLGANSFDLLELVTAFEDEFELTLDDEVLSSIATVGDAVTAIEQSQ